MLHLIAASFLWAFSFGLIKGQLSGIDPVAVACGRLVLAALAFLPFALKERLHGAVLGQAFLLGLVQFGVMYILYIAAYQWLPAWLVALFTIFTPLYVILLADVRAGRWTGRNLLAAVLAVAGAGVVVIRGLEDTADWRGVLLLQAANLCFAWGQLRYGGLVRRAGVRESSLLGWMYLGAAGFALLAVGGRVVQGSDLFAGWDAGALAVLVYLGLLPTALGFYLWNRGAARTAPGLLAAANNLKVPLAVLVSWIVFGEQADNLRVLAGLALIVAGLFAARPPREMKEAAD
jgi:drug/metabolite transporter (DMT)-like permease